jgi:hypothetical protein
LEVIIKDASNTLKAELLKREKRIFEIGFKAINNVEHTIQVLFNGLQMEG